MSTKVLVFESDASFAGELRSELGRLGCAAQIVDDGNAGLQAAAQSRPDLILLSIELPRMNGFSVCNKLKKDPSLKDVPLIIMSSESSDETFEQHRKLRTRAEDYVHKPIAFGELLEHITRYVPLQPANGPSGTGEDSAIIIDDEIQLEDAVSVREPSVRPPAVPRKASGLPPPLPGAKGGKVDAEVDAFAESAFGRLLDDVVDGSSGAGAASSVEHAAQSVDAASPSSSSEAKKSAPSMAPKGVTSNSHPSVPPPSSIAPGAPRSSADAAEMDRLRAEIERHKTEVVRLEREVSAARAALRLEDDKDANSSDEIDRLRREVDELRAKASTGAKTGGVSSREFLDLREALNKKDKEILGLREQMSRKEKDLIDARDSALVIEREKADQEDRIGALDKDLGDAKATAERERTEKEQAVKRARELEDEGKKTQQELDAIKADLAKERAQAAVAKEEHQRAVEAALSDRKAAVEAAEESGRKNVASAKEEAAAAAELVLKDVLANAAIESDMAKGAALATREAELSREHEARLLAFERANHEEQSRLKEELNKAEGNLASARSELLAKAPLEAELSTTRENLTAAEKAKSELRGELDQRTLERDRSNEDLASARERTASLERDLASREADLSGLRSKLAEESEKSGRALSAIEENRGSLERAKDALAAALAQIDEAEARGRL